VRQFIAAFILIFQFAVRGSAFQFGVREFIPAFWAINAHLVA
jgi:hypothetical protein